MEYKNLEAATNNFSKDYLVGEGGSSRVYKAKLRSGSCGAIKVLIDDHHTMSEFQVKSKPLKIGVCCKVGMYP
jgi:hypothetical protein